LKLVKQVHVTASTSAQKSAKLVSRFSLPPNPLASELSTKTAKKNIANSQEIKKAKKVYIHTHTHTVTHTHTHTHTSLLLDIVVSLGGTGQGVQ